MSKLNRALAWNPLGSAADMDVLWFDALKAVAQSPRPLWNRHLVTNCFHHFHSFSFIFIFHLFPSWSQAGFLGQRLGLSELDVEALGDLFTPQLQRAAFFKAYSTTYYNYHYLQSTTHEQFFNVLHTIKVWVSSKDCPKQPHTGVELCAKRDTMWNHVRPFDMKRRWKLWNRFEHFEMQHLDTFVYRSLYTCGRFASFFRALLWGPGRTFLGWTWDALWWNLWHDLTTWTNETRRLRHQPMIPQKSTTICQVDYRQMKRKVSKVCLRKLRPWVGLTENLLGICTVVMVLAVIQFYVDYIMYRERYQWGRDEVW